MTCKCKQCEWPVHTKRTAIFDCPRCKAKIHCTQDPLSLDQWPAWALLIKRLARPSDKGIGDTVQRIAARFGGELFKRFAKRAGMPCGCTERQSEWNTRFSYHGGDDDNGGDSLESREATP